MTLTLKMIVTCERLRPRASIFASTRRQDRFLPVFSGLTLSLTLTLTLAGGHVTRRREWLDLDELLLPV